MRRGNVLFILKLVVLFVGSYLLLSVVCGVNPLISTMTVAVGVPVFGVILPAWRASHRIESDEADVNQSCRPILKRYRRKHNADRLVSEYDEWSTGKHSSQTRTLFAQEVAAALIAEGLYDNARTVIEDGRKASKGCHLEKDYVGFALLCEEKMAVE